ncbi:MAG: YhfC family intramembrane metalloprotease [Lachnospiraceae bacterium]|nr:YhfC family intramembrane metalloprotease [Lachnospiraceae bacterium]
MGTVPELSIIFMVISSLAGFAMPVILFIFFRKKKEADILPFFVGCAVMLVFALILESAVHQIVLGSSVGERILGNIWLYALYGGLMAGLFEETGRFIAFKTVLRKKQDKDVNALMYGAGHGGFEAAVLLGITMISNIAIAVMINSGNTSVLTETLSGDTLTQMEAAIEDMTTTAPYMFLIGIIERVFAVTLQIALSVIVWTAVKNKKRWYLYPAAILIHFIVDAAAVILMHYNVPTLLIEVLVGVMAVLAAVFAKNLSVKSC